MDEMADDVIINTYRGGFIAQFAIIILMGNENAISDFVSEIYNKLVKNSLYSIEIVISAYSSKDNESKIRYLSTKVPLKASLSHCKESYAARVKNGLLLVSAPYVVISDSDGQLESDDFFMLKKQLDQLSNPSEVIITGRRKVIIEDLHRKLISQIVNKLSSIIFDLDSNRDIVSQCQLMSTEIAKALSSECRFMNENFWMEFEVRARNKNIGIIEVEVKCTKRLARGSVVYKKSIPMAVTRTLIGLVRLKRDLTGKSFVVSLFQTKSIRRLITFALVGSSAAILTLFLTWLGVNLGLYYLFSAAIGIQTSIGWAFLLHDRITFKDKIDSYQLSNALLRFLKYNISSLGGQAINLSTLFLLTSAGLFYLYSEMVAIMVAFTFNYTLSRKWVWARK